ncbi:uncharacterized protein LOC130800137 isoform X3 [Amaranthus tricolor]|uniref:uncharacterized protein LOC130800137 isoform X3 n=1 Tax=Amaranthus tricolor TaxID=29722 RepID=UPI0025846C30|nr:uncharacterized protein LOC130800137 isoform X3 [Amaranthus tricolor]
MELKMKAAPAPQIEASIPCLSRSSASPINSCNVMNRRDVLASVSVSVSACINAIAGFSVLSTQLVEAADARGLFQMPPFRLNNRYYLVRSGESEYESLGIINTNPVAKTSVDSGLSEKGKRQSVKAGFELKKMGACEGSCWIWPSITQRAYQAAEIIGEINKIDRSHIVPEYSFLDARGLGAYEGKPLESISEVYATDGVSPNLKPPAIDDGTPNESVEDVFVRVTQLMSILETQYSGDTVIIVSPDSDNLTILQAGLLGLDLRRHTDLSFSPGEVRFIDEKSIPVYKKPSSNIYKCYNPPNCRFCLSVSILGFIYSAFQAFDVTKLLATGKHVINHHLRYQFEFIMDQFDGSVVYTWTYISIGDIERTLRKVHSSGVRQRDTGIPSDISLISSSLKGC